MEKPYLFLDLDNTLICSVAIHELEPNWRDRSPLFTMTDMEDYYIIFHRPYLQEFLDWAFDNFTVNVWTAANKDYALFVISNVISPLPKRHKRKVRFVFFDKHCDESRKHFGKQSPKDLRLITDVYQIIDKHSKIFIIDDLDEVVAKQKLRAIQIKPFEISDEDSHHDRELVNVKTKLISRLKV